MIYAPSITATTNRKRGFWYLSACLGLVLSGCVTAKGGLGQPCDAQPGASFGTTTYSCNTGLTCNSGLASPTCETPNADGTGTRCSSDRNCAIGLYCASTPGGSGCSAWLAEGAPCPSGVGCAAGLTCVKVLDGTALCATVDAAAASPAGDDGAMDAPDASIDVETAPTCPIIAPPTFMPGTGSTILLGDTVTIVPPTMPANFATSGGVILYTLDSSLPVAGGASTKVYNGPIQQTTFGMTTVNAVAAIPGSACAPSVMVTATFTTGLEECGCGSFVIFTPPSVTQSNDFLVAATSGVATNICFTTDGTTPPTCDKATGKCTGTSQTYNAGAGLGAPGSITINGGTTNPATGKVTVQAIACTAGKNPSHISSQIYTLQAGDPTMQGPAPGNLAYNDAGYMPTMGTVTYGATLRWASDGSMPTCNTGTAILDPLSQPLNPGPLPVRTNVTYAGIACKSGYAPSANVTFPYTVSLAPPGFVDSTSLAIAEGTGTYDRTFTIAFDPTPDTYTCAGCGGQAAGLYACYSMSAMPVCGATAGTCTTGIMANVFGAAMVDKVAVSTTGTVVNVVACSPSFNSSPPATATYTLQLALPGLTLPGCTPMVGTDKDCTLATAGAPITSFLLPASGYAPMVQESFGRPPPSAATNPAYGFVCAAKGAMPGCNPSGCASGTAVNPAGLQSFQASVVSGNAVPLANAVPNGTIAIGDSWSFIGCPGSASPGFIASKVTTVSF